MYVCMYVCMYVLYVSYVHVLNSWIFWLRFSSVMILSPLSLGWLLNQSLHRVSFNSSRLVKNYRTRSYLIYNIQEPLWFNHSTKSAAHPSDTYRYIVSMGQTCHSQKPRGKPNSRTTSVKSGRCSWWKSTKREPMLSWWSMGDLRMDGLSGEIPLKWMMAGGTIVGSQQMCMQVFVCLICLLGYIILSATCQGPWRLHFRP